MSYRRNLYVASGIGASISYIFNALAFTGNFNIIRWFVFMTIFFIVTYLFEKFIEWQIEK